MEQKVFVTRSGKANFFCPECGVRIQIDVSKYNTEEKEVKLKCNCSCGHVFPAILERRKYIRRNVGLPGDLISGGEKYPMKVIDISIMGLKIKTRKALDLYPGDKVILAFVLDDAGESRISKEAVIRKINQSNINVEFLSNEHYDKFGPYLLFHFT